MPTSKEENSGWLRVSTALVGATGVAAAAFGAHGLEKIANPDQVRWWAIGVAIQLVIAPVLLALTREEKRGVHLSPILFLLGILLFSGSLYAMALGAPRILGAVTPLGGLAMILGWILLAFPPRKPE